MISGHDKAQDRRIAANAKAIENLVKYMREVRDHFEPIYGLAEKVPEKWTKTVLKLRTFAKLGVVFVILAKVGGWYFNKQTLHKMADRYAEVARRLYYTENNPDVALPFVDKALEIEKESPEYIFFRAYIKGMAATRDLLNLGRPFNKTELDRAHQAYAEAVFLQGLEPERPEPYILQGQILAALKETARAKEAIEKAVSLDPQSDFALMRLAMVQLDEKDVAGAEASLEKSLELNPKSKWAWLWKGVVAMDFKKDPEAARACCDKALEIDPKFDLARYNRGWTYATGKAKRYGLAREEMKKALSFYEKAIAADEKYDDAYARKAAILAKTGKSGEAVAAIGRAIAVTTYKPERFWVQKGDILDAAGKSAEAADCYSKARCWRSRFGAT